MVGAFRKAALVVTLGAMCGSAAATIVASNFGKTAAQARQQFEEAVTITATETFGVGSPTAGGIDIGPVGTFTTPTISAKIGCAFPAVGPQAATSACSIQTSNTDNVGGDNGRFDTSADPSNPNGRYLRSNENENDTEGGTIAVEFAAALHAFGFYLTDLGDFGDAGITFQIVGRDENNVVVFDTSLPSNDDSGSLGFFGFYDAALTVKSFTITLPVFSGSDDIFGLDDIVVGRVNDDNPVPEPASIALVGAALLAAAGRSRRNRAAKR